MDERDEIIRDGISNAFKNELVTKWVVLVETVAPDGTKGMWTIPEEGMKSWEILGALEFAKMLCQAKIVSDRSENEE